MPTHHDYRSVHWTDFFGAQQLILIQDCHVLGFQFQLLRQEEAQGLVG
jgi:hypothetical protein